MKTKCLICHSVDASTERMLSLAARGFWLELRRIMATAKMIGFAVRHDMSPLTLNEIARVSACSTDEATKLLQELNTCGAVQIGSDGCIYQESMIDLAGGAAQWSHGCTNSSIRRAKRMNDAKSQATHTPEEWAAVLAEVQGECVRCGDNSSPLTKDHIVPVSDGGSDGIQNLQPLCQSCNSCKGMERVNWLEQWRNGRGNA
jgi:hypothetical protein